MKIFPKAYAAFKYGKGIGHFYKGRYKKAIELIERSNELDPEAKENTWHSYSVLGRSYLALGNIDKAEYLLKKALEMIEQTGKDNLGKFDHDEYMATLTAYDKIVSRKLNNDTK